MKKCNTEIMKDIKNLTMKKAELLDYEQRECLTTYAENEKPIVSEYDYVELSKKIDEIDDNIRHLKQLLSYANSTVIVEGFDMTIAEALVYLAQLQSKKSRLNQLKNRAPLTRESANYRSAVVEYTKTNYDVTIVQKEYDEVVDKIQKLQMAIDRTNLTNMIDC